MNDDQDPSSNRDDEAARKFAGQLDVSPALHQQDFILKFLLENAAFSSPALAYRYYFYNGRESATSLRNIIAGEGLDPDQEFSLLEFACGYGCVSRHMANIFPHVDLACCDIHDEAIEFLGKELGCRPILSSHSPEALEIDEQFEVVFALSFFSHMPRTTWLRWLRTLLARVKPGGILVFTTQGLESARVFLGNPAIPDDGFWFRADSEQKDLDTAEYGQTVVSETFVRFHIEQLPGAELSAIRPKFWWKHQDTWIVRRTE